MCCGCYVKCGQKWKQITRLCIIKILKYTIQWQRNCKQDSIAIASAESIDKIKIVVDLVESEEVQKYRRTRCRRRWIHFLKLFHNPSCPASSNIYSLEQLFYLNLHDRTLDELCLVIKNRVLQPNEDNYCSLDLNSGMYLLNRKHWDMLSVDYLKTGLTILAKSNSYEKFWTAPYVLISEQKPLDDPGLWCFYCLFS